MGLEKYSNENMREISMVEIAYEILEDENNTVSFNELYNQVAKEKELTDDEKTEYIAQFYTDLNVDGRFISVGSNVWGLKQWYPYDKTEEDIVVLEEAEIPKKKKKKKKKKSDTDNIDEEPEEDYLKEDLTDVDAGFAEEDNVNLFGQMDEEREDAEDDDFEGDEEETDDLDTDENEEK